MIAAFHVVVWLIVLWICCTELEAQVGPGSWTASPFNAPALPLAVRSPYLNVWLAQGNNPASLSTSWPTTWDGKKFFGWYALVVVDETAYRILGESNVPVLPVAHQNSGGVHANAHVVHVHGRSDAGQRVVHQSNRADRIPFTYVIMSATSTDESAHNLRMFMNVDGELITGDVAQPAQWTSDDEGDYITLTMELQAPQAYTENSNHAQDATEYFSFKKINGTRLGNYAEQCQPCSRREYEHYAWKQSGHTVSNWPTLGIAVDWSNISQTPEPAVWAVGLVQSPSIQYRTPDALLQDRYPYFLSAYSDGATAAKAFLDDFPRAQSNSGTFDSQLVAARQQYSSDYADLLALSARQVMASLDITLSKDGAGGWDMSNVKVFMKNMGGIGSDAVETTLSVNAVDMLYAAFPAFMYLNPELGGYLLAPLLEYQDPALYTLSYAARNIGLTYPNATVSASSCF